ncbi:hypothetical protein [Roseibium sp.]|uniref:hypothetical protein n=1 Tax=Roseibium sp. TaxID=1936156 RepID=UPI003A970C22
MTATDFTRSFERRPSPNTLSRKAIGLALASCALLVGTGSAYARPDLRQLTCAQAQNMVRDNGQVVFTTSNTTYSMFVSNRRYCDARQSVRTQFGPTADNPRCPVAYECFEPLFRRGDIFD